MCFSSSFLIHCLVELNHEEAQRKNVHLKVDIKRSIVQMKIFHQHKLMNGEYGEEKQEEH